MKLKHILILQNKIDLVKESQAKEQYEQILAFVQGESVDLHFINLKSNTPIFSARNFCSRTRLKLWSQKQQQLGTFPSNCHVSPAGTVAEGAPIIPISAQLKYNIEVVCEYIVKKIPVPIRDFTSEPRLIGTWNKRLLNSNLCFYMDRLWTTLGEYIYIFFQYY